MGQIKIQLTYIPHIFWAACLVYLFIIVCVTLIERPESGIITAALAPLLFTLTAPFLQRNIYGSMRELEASCKYNTQRLYAGSMAIGGTVNMVVMLVSSAIFSAVAGAPFIKLWFASIFFFCTSSAFSLILSVKINSWMSGVFGAVYSVLLIIVVETFGEALIELSALISTFHAAIAGVLSVIVFVLTFKWSFKILNQKGEFA